ncbi:MULTISPECIES: FAD-dependent monooxygenase [unclassified Legionella]|uniref:FAD-dependent monooxygenase n=1 Tax=unclassified Legionella TaxID=2622702 RepID=UPI0010553C86|nr:MULTISPECIES: FAD-dependent monooxygenase [unclassified Legionella]MDI9818493.1 FAD-dependent monooxygenase [Legionella sp. PL877]
MVENLLDVLVVGAGPVGLFCANELIRHGLNCRIIDKKTTLSDKSKALGIHIRTLDVMADCGFIDQVLTQGHQVDGALFKVEDKQLADISFAALKANYPFLIDLPQDQTEQILNQGLLNKGLTVEWQTELTSIEQTTNNITALIKHNNGNVEKVTASWIIACDGSHSTLRELVGAKFIGDNYKQTWWLADLFIDWHLPQNKMIIYVSKEGPVACFPIGEKRYRLVMTAPEELSGKTPALTEIEQVFRKRCGDEKATLSNPLWISQFGINHRQIDNYRHNQVFFAGDAAHVHSPMGGQGLNTGIQDIYNLVWKLALVKKGIAKNNLLDSYQLERHPVGKEVLKKTGIMTHMILLKNPLLIRLRNHLVKWLTSFATLRELIAGDLAELRISYDKSPIVKSLGKKIKLTAGTFPPDFFLMEAQTKEVKSLQAIIRGTKHHLFLFAGDDQKQFPALLKTASFASQHLGSWVNVHLIISHENMIPDSFSVFIDDGEIHQRFALTQTAAIWIRPDKYIGLTQSPINQEELGNYLQTYSNTLPL